MKRGRKLTLVVAVLCLAIQPIFAKGKFTAKETLNRTEVCNGGCLVSRETNKLVIKGSYDWGGPIMLITNESTKVSVQFGDFSFESVLGDADNYQHGDTKATFTRRVPMKANSSVVLKLTVSWANGVSKFKATVIDNYAYSALFSNNPDGTYDLAGEMKFGMDTVSENVISLSRSPGIGTAKVSKKNSTTNVGDITKTKVRVSWSHLDE